MKKITLLLLALITILQAYSYDDVLLKAQASIFPKIMLLDKKIEEKLIDGEIIYTIVYDQQDHDTAKEIKKFIDENNNGFFDKYAYKINLVKSSELSSLTQTSAIYALITSQNSKKIANIAKEKGIISFSYDINDLKNGFLFSLMLEKSAVLYLNKANLYTNKVDFVVSLLQMVKFVD